MLLIDAQPPKVAPRPISGDEFRRRLAFFEKIGEQPLTKWLDMTIP
jgi:hypothetical protein